MDPWMRLLQRVMGCWIAQAAKVSWRETMFAQDRVEGYSPSHVAAAEKAAVDGTLG
jgi:hypothetical protein